MQYSFPSRRVSKATLFVLMLTLMVSCTPDITLPSPTPTAPVTVTPDSSPKIIPFFTTESDPDQLSVLQSLIAEYQDLNPGIEVDIIIASPASRGTRLLTSLASGADLGIFEIEPALMSKWADAGYLRPLDDVVTNIGAHDFVEGSLFRQNETTYAVPYAVSVYGLWVRKDLFEQAGLPLPTTYEEVLRAAEILTNNQMYGIALPAGQNIATVNYFSTFLWQNGGDYFTCDGRVAFGEPQAHEAVRRWQALTQYAPPGFTTWGFPEQIDAFVNGRVAMAMYAGRLGVQLEESHPELADKVTVIFPPWGEQKVTLGVWSRFAIASGTKNQAEAKAFLQWLVSGDRLLRYDNVLPGHMIPPLNSVRKETFINPSAYTQAHADWIQSFYDWSAFTNHPAMNMGSVSNGQFKRSDIAPPWAWEVFGTPGIVDTMLQNVANGNDSEQDWQAAVKEMERTVQAWKSMHPQWESAGCR
ncbi:MAG TPA: sugar ABC transporter substrate-binding protein [Anaerolineales bacterium]|nr:sugar ABC transporter substrate-binding protein [Anaerolineales bacterium]